MDNQENVISGLYEDNNSDWILHTQNITLNGQDKVYLSQPLIRAYRMFNNGSVELVGDIYCYVNTTISSGVPNNINTIKAKINLGNEQTFIRDVKIRIKVR